MAAITYDHATIQYPGAERPSVNALNLDIADGEFLVLVGPSGCGKSTSLRALAGLESVSEGTIRIGDRDVTHLAPKDRDIAMVFQNYALYPHMTVADNMGFALKISGMNKDEMRKRVEEAAKILDLTQYLDRKPKALSGGQRQRVAMGRAIVRNPQAFLMDEPLSNLDAKLRVQTRTEIAALQRRLGVTTVYVTHDQVEAMTMGDRVCVLKDGDLMQVDTPRNLYDKPDNVFVAGFIGSPAMNLLEVDLEQDGAHHGGRTFPLPRETMAALSGEGAKTATLGFRPESTKVVGEGEGYPFEVVVVEELGSDAFAYGTMHTSRSKEGDKLITLRVDARKPPMKGETIHVQIDPAEAHVFSTETGRRVSGDVAPAGSSTGNAPSGGATRVS
jgi:multiple sugar transport system ATP-binding protein